MVEEEQLSLILEERCRYLCAVPKCCSAISGRFGVCRTLLPDFWFDKPLLHCSWYLASLSEFVLLKSSMCFP